MKLKPCPFCGSKAISHEYTKRRFVIYCNGQYCQAEQEWKTLQEAIKAWNTRKDSQDG